MESDSDVVAPSIAARVREVREVGDLGRGLNPSLQPQWIKLARPSFEDPVGQAIPPHRHDDNCSTSRRILESDVSSSPEELQSSPSPIPSDQPAVLAMPRSPTTADEDNTLQLAPITFLEGSQTLNPLPPHLRDQLQTFLQLTNSNEPDCVRTRWVDPLSLGWSEAGRPVWFENSKTGRRVDVARYQYGKKSQFIVAQEKSHRAGDDMFNRGEAAIVAFDVKAPVCGIVDGVRVTKKRWVVWNPLRTVGEKQWVWRVSEGTKVVKQETDDGVTWGSNVLQGSGQDSSDGFSESNFSVTTLEGGRRKRKSRSGRKGSYRDGPVKASAAIRRALKRSYHATVAPADVQDHISSPPPVVDSESVGNDIRHEVMSKHGERLAQFPCELCTESTFTTQFGLTTHMRIRHNVPLEGSAAPIETNETIVVKLPTPEPPLTPPDTPGAKDVADEPQIQFLTNQSGSVQRVRPLSAVNSVQKLFINALAAGVAGRGTLMLSACVDGGENGVGMVNVVKGDNEDFQRLMEMIEKGRKGGRDVVVNVWKDDYDIDM
ncbi:hypothetical protein R6Q59_009882 [Mikania micrantha]